MVAKKPRIVIIGAGMAGLTAANMLYTCSRDMFELHVVEGGNRIGGRINTSQFCGDRIEMGATWIHGIGGSPIHKIAREIHAIHSEQPWECMSDSLEQPRVIAEGGFVVNPSLIDPITQLFNNLMDLAQGKKRSEKNGPGLGKVSIGSFLKHGLQAYWDSVKDPGEVNGYGNWSRKLLEEAVFAIHENTQRTYTSAGDLFTLDYEAESEYMMFPGEEITIAKGYMRVIESLASVLPRGLIKLGCKVTKIDWKSGVRQSVENGVSGHRPVKLHFSDGSAMVADHVIVTVSLGVLKANISHNSGLFNPPLPDYKVQAISRLGFGVVNKLFMQVSSSNEDSYNFPNLQMAFHRPESEFRDENVPWWMRKTASISPIYDGSSVLLSWFAGKEALELESLSDEEIINGVSATISSFLSQPYEQVNCNSHESSNGNVENSFKISKVLKSKWGNDPLFLGSYSYIAVGSSGDDCDKLAEPLPETDHFDFAPPFQILFAGEATHRTHYSTTHGAYFSGLREANRLLQHYNVVKV